MSRFLTKLVVEASDDQRSATLIRPLEYESDLLHSDVIVPAGFRTDFASVPRLFWNIFPPLGRYGDAAVIHDFLYRWQDVDRQTADAIFFEAMDSKGCGFATRWTLWAAVRSFGWCAWKKNRKRH